MTVYALGDMIIYNRRKRAEFFTEQKARYQAAIHSAKLAVESGRATEAEIEFLQRDSAEQARLDAIKAAKANRKGIFKRSSEWLFSGMKKEEQIDGTGNSELSVGNEALDRVDNSLNGRATKDMTTLKDSAKQAFANEKERQQNGGPLDRLGTSSRENTTEPPKSGGWTSFFTRRS